MECLEVIAQQYGDVKGASQMIVMPSGTLAGVARIDNEWKLFKDDTCMETIDGYAYKIPYRIHAAPSGALAGSVQIDNRWKLFVDDAIIETIDGYEYSDLAALEVAPDGALTGSAKVNGRQIFFIHNGTEYVSIDKVNKP